MKQITEKESRILVFLNQVDLEKRYLSNIATKLETDYGYIIKVVAKLENKNWIKKVRSHGKSFITLTEESPIERAEAFLSINSFENKESE